jgi:diadenylate cyclase
MQEILSKAQWAVDSFEIRHLVDIAIVAFLIYEVLRLVRGTRAVQMAIGLILVGVLYWLSAYFELTTVEWVIRTAAVYLGFTLIILFQREIRAGLTHLGNNFIVGQKRTNNPFGEEWYDEVVLAATTLSSEKTGALMVFEREVGLKLFIETGIRLDARVNYDLLVTIFNTHTPLHDGALIISNARIAAACCFLPLTQNPRISRELGTRHRAAIGVTEDSDGFAVIVSEETGAISFAIGGRLRRNLDGPGLRGLIQQAMEPWRSEDETEEIEREERIRDEQLEALSRQRRRDTASSRENQPESRKW